MKSWHFVGLFYSKFEYYIPGIKEALVNRGVEYIIVDNPDQISRKVTLNPDIVLIGAAHERCAMELFIWAKLNCIPVVSIEEVAQLSLNDFDLNNYHLPFDKLFVANETERSCFASLGYPDDMLVVSGLLHHDLLRPADAGLLGRLSHELNLDASRKTVLYTTSPLRHRFALHNQGDLQFRTEVLRSLSRASHKREYNVIVKLHPNENLCVEGERIRKVLPDAIVLGREANTNNLIALADVVINRGNSQTALDAVCQGRSCVIIACGLRTLFHKHGGAYVVDDLCELPMCLERAVSDGPPDTVSFLAHNYFRPTGGTAPFIAREIERLAGSRIHLTPSEWECVLKSTLFCGDLAGARRLCHKVGKKTGLLGAVGKALRCQMLPMGRSAAARAWRKCSQIDPAWYGPSFEMAHLFLAGGQYEKCVEESQRAISLHPPYYRLWHEVPMKLIQSSAFRAMGNFPEADRCMKVLRLRGFADLLPEMLLEEAMTAASEGRVSTTCRRLQKVIAILERFPLHPEWDRDLYFRCGAAFLGIDHRKQAIWCFRRMGTSQKEDRGSAFAGCSRCRGTDRGNPAAHEGCFSSDEKLTEEDFRRIMSAISESGFDPGRSRCFSVVRKEVSADEVVCGLGRVFMELLFSGIGQRRLDKVLHGFASSLRLAIYLLLAIKDSINARYF